MLNPTMKGSHKFSENFFDRTLTIHPGPNPGIEQLPASGTGRGPSTRRSICARNLWSNGVRGRLAPMPAVRCRGTSGEPKTTVILYAANDPVPGGIISGTREACAAAGFHPKAQPSESSPQVRIWAWPSRCHSRTKRGFYRGSLGRRSFAHAPTIAAHPRLSRLKPRR